MRASRDTDLPRRQTTKARAAFERAKHAFENGNYVEAQGLAARAEAAISNEVNAIEVGKRIDSPKASIVIVVYQLTDDVRAALRCSELTSDDYEVVIVDNGAALTPELILDSGLRSFVLISVGFNYGCCGGRNIGARHARSDLIVFIDDDGILVDGSINALIGTIQNYDSIAVRGKVVPKSNQGIVGGHYDLGDDIVFAPPTTEGISIWQKWAFLEHGGFDTLLSGHEGILLYAKLVRLYGPEAFLYTPDAVLRHDYAHNAASVATKRQRQQKMQEYTERVYQPIIPLRQTLNKKRKDKDIAILRGIHIRSSGLNLASSRSALEPISIITTSKNGAEYLHEYYNSIDRQTYTELEIIFVDDGSCDNSEFILRELAGNDNRLHYIATEPIGRSAALNLALTHASHDLCAIADVDDISMPHRLETTARFFADNPGASCVSFLKFNEAEFFGGAAWRMSPLIGVRTRSITGMPVVFPAFAFRKSNFLEKFDNKLSAGVDCDWIQRNLKKNPGIDGKVIPINMVYYGVHGNQITAKLPNLQNEVAIRCCHDMLKSIIGYADNDTNRMAALFSGRAVPEASELAHVYCFAERLLRRNISSRVVCQYELELVLDFIQRRLASARPHRSPLEVFLGKAASVRKDPKAYLAHKAKQIIRRLQVR